MPVIRRAIAAHIRSWGYEAVEVEDFEQVMGIFTREEPHLVLLDISLPFFNGFRLVYADSSGIQGSHYFYFIGGR